MNRKTVQIGAVPYPQGNNVKEAAKKYGYVHGSQCKTIESRDLHVILEMAMCAYNQKSNNYHLVNSIEGDTDLMVVALPFNCGKFEKMCNHTVVNTIKLASEENGIIYLCLPNLWKCFKSDYITRNGISKLDILGNTTDDWHNLVAIVLFEELCRCLDDKSETLAIWRDIDEEE